MSIPAFPDSFRFDRFTREGKAFGRAGEDVDWQTEITGYHVEYKGPVAVSGVILWVHFELFECGLLTAYEGTEYDFGSGPAIDDLPVIYASLKHDIGCHLTNMRKIPWEWRAWFDADYRKGLKFYGCPWYRRAWQWAGVRTYSTLIARWRDKQ